MFLYHYYYIYCQFFNAAASIIVTISEGKVWFICQ